MFDCSLVISCAQLEYVIFFLYILQAVTMEHYCKRGSYCHFYWKYQRDFLSLITVYSHWRSKYKEEGKREKSQGCQLAEHSLAAVNLEAVWLFSFFIRLFFLFSFFILFFLLYYFLLISHLFLVPVLSMESILHKHTCYCCDDNQRLTVETIC